jgi:hypothetical protein
MPKIKGYDLRWPSIKDIMRAILKYEHIVFAGESYDLKHGVAYSCKGSNLMGVGTVSVSGLCGSRYDHFLTSFDDYVVVEFPSLNSRHRWKGDGDFVGMFMSDQFKTITVAKIHHYERGSGVGTVECCDYDVIGRFMPTSERPGSEVTALTKISRGADCGAGINSYGIGFDVNEGSRRAAYGGQPLMTPVQRACVRQRPANSKKFRAMPFRKKRRR